MPTAMKATMIAAQINAMISELKVSFIRSMTENLIVRNSCFIKWKTPSLLLLYVESQGDRDFLGHYYLFIPIHRGMGLLVCLLLIFFLCLFRLRHILALRDDGHTVVFGE